MQMEDEYGISIFQNLEAGCISLCMTMLMYLDLSLS
jgi:hypothetical protein